MKKILFGIGLFLIVGAIAFLYLMRSSLPTSNISTWQTYHNNTYGFEIKYPPDFTNVATLLDPQMPIGKQTLFEKGTIEDSDVVFVDASLIITAIPVTSPSECNLAAYMKGQQGAMFKEDSSLEIWKKKDTPASPGRGKEVEFYVASKHCAGSNEHDIFSVDVTGGISGEFDASFPEEIISTFKFTS